MGDVQPLPSYLFRAMRDLTIQTRPAYDWWSAMLLELEVIEAVFIDVDWIMGCMMYNMLKMLLYLSREMYV